MHDRPTRTRRTWSPKIKVLAAVVAALAATGVAPLAGAAVAQAAVTAPAAGTTHYAIGVPVCPVPTKRHAECTAVRRVEVSSTTPGALAYKPAGGVTTSLATAGPATTIGPAGGLTPADLASAYGYTSTAAATGQTVAIVDAYNDPNLNADLQAFDTQYGLSTCSTANGCLKIVNQTGGATPPPNDTTGWSVEESLDVDTVHSVCENCKIVLVEATNNSNANLEKAEDEAVTLGATEVTNSFGGDEAGSTATDEAAYNHPGVVITASAGDDGFDDFDWLGSQGIISQPEAPASFSSVVAVGGTSLYLGQSAARQSEAVWNDNGVKDYDQYLTGEALGAGGGGCSKVITAPTWQSKLSAWPGTSCGTHRLVADIGADADYLTGFDIYDTYSCGASCSPAVLGWNTYGGTSLASPIVASMFALAGGAQGVADPALTLYGHLGSTSLYDVTSGGNGYCGGEGAAACGNPNAFGDGILDCDYPATGTVIGGDRACDALVGYDGPTGVGTPKGLGAFAKTGPSATISGSASVVHATSKTWTAAAKDPFPGGTITGYSWAWGDGTAATVTTIGSAAHTYATAGAYTITLTITDSYGMTGTATFAVTVT